MITITIATLVIATALAFTYILITNKELINQIYDTADFSDSASLGKFALVSVGAASSITMYAVIAIITIFQISRWI